MILKRVKSLFVLIGLFFFVHNAYSYFDEGYFTGTPFKGYICTLQESERLPFLDGEIVVFNRNRNDNYESSIVCYRVHNTIQWIIEMDFKSIKRFGNNVVFNIRDLRLFETNDEYLIGFIFDWGYAPGQEAAMHIDKKGKFKYFYYLIG